MTITTNDNEQLTTITCANCGATHSYVKKRKAKKYCSHKCGVSFYGREIRDKKAQRERIKKHHQKHPEKRFHSALKSSAKDRGLEFDLSEEWIKKKLAKGICEVSGMPIRPKIGTKKKGRDFYSVSFDRIDNSQGYTKSNVRAVSWGYNLGKNKFSDRDINALSLGVVLQHIPKSLKETFVEMLPQSLISDLPSGFKV